MAITRGKLVFKDSSKKDKKRKIIETTAVEPETKLIDTDTLESGLTLTERRFRRRLIESEEKSANKTAKTTHRQKIDKYNSNLASLTEHNDIPRISAAGNG